METGDPGTPGGAPDAERTPPGASPPPPPPGTWPPPPPPGWNPNPLPPPPDAWPPPPPPGAWTPSPAWAPPPPPAAPWGTPPGAVPGWHAGPPGWHAAPSGVGAFRPRGVGELLDGAFTLYRRNFLLLVAIAAMVQVPFALIQLLFFELSGVGDRVSSIRGLISSGATQGGLTPDQSSQLTGDLGTAVAYYGLVFVVQYLVVYPLSLAATTSAVSARYLDQPASVGGSYRAALSRWRSIIVLVLSLVLIVAAGVAVSALLAVLTGAVVLFDIGVFAALLVYVTLLVRTAVGPQSIVLEKLGGVAGIRRSWQLTTGSGWRTFGIVALLGIIQLIAANVIVLPLDAAIARSDPATQLLVSQVGAAVTAVFVAPITLVTLTLLYYDLRIRREGFDIEMLAASL